MEVGCTLDISFFVCVLLKGMETEFWKY